MKQPKSKHLTALSLAFCVALFAASDASARGESPIWSDYLDQAYVFSSSGPGQLSARLTSYGEAAGVSLETYATEYFETIELLGGSNDDATPRRKAIALLLRYLTSRDAEFLDASVESIRALEHRLGRLENRYWYHYILAHKALESGDGIAFVEQTFAMWLRVVIPLESSYAKMDRLALSGETRAGFVGALPFVYENLARIILVRSPQHTLDTDIDPLGAIIRLLHQGRIGGHPEAIPAAASSKTLVRRVASRLDGRYSDDGSLTFVLALAQAEAAHARADTLLSDAGPVTRTLQAVRATLGAYARAFDGAQTVQGRSAVYVRALRQLRTLFAAKQRQAASTDIDSPFSLPGAIALYTTLHEVRDGGWAELGYAEDGRDAYFASMRELWSEIQETGLTTADYYLTQGVQDADSADESTRNAVRLFERYISFFDTFALPGSRNTVPAAAYFGAFEAHKGVGDAYLSFAMRTSPEETTEAMAHYRLALELFPFDRLSWAAFTRALTQQGQEDHYWRLTQPAAEHVLHSPAVEAWIQNGESGAKKVDALRSALSSRLAITYMGFSDAAEISRHEAEVEELGRQRSKTAARLAGLEARRDQLTAHDTSVPAAIDKTDSSSRLPDLQDVARELRLTRSRLQKIDGHVLARSEALPLYRAALETDGMAHTLRADRDHPLHDLLHRMYHESWRKQEGKDAR